MSSASTVAPTKAPPGGGRIGVAALSGAVSAPGCDLPCQSGDADLWFAEDPAELERAKGFCVTCLIRAACLAGALARGEPWGVRGGEIVEQGVVVARKRPRGRPRKSAVENTSPRRQGTA